MEAGKIVIMKDGLLRVSHISPGLLFHSQKTLVAAAALVGRTVIGSTLLWKESSGVLLICYTIIPLSVSFCLHVKADWRKEDEGREMEGKKQSEREGVDFSECRRSLSQHVAQSK